MTRSIAVQLVNELRAAGRITTVEAEALRAAMLPVPPALAAIQGPIRTIADLFDRFDGSANVGRVIGKPTSHAHTIRYRGSVPVTYWPALIAAARDIGFDLDETMLVRLHLASPMREHSG